MKKIKLLFLISLLSFCAGYVFAQEDIGPDTRLNVPGNWGISPSEINELQNVVQDTRVPEYLLREYNAAKRNGNDNEKMRLGTLIDTYLGVPAPTTDPNTVPVTEPNRPPFNADWGIGDIRIHNGDVAYSGGFRQYDLKQGEDGNLYLVVNRRNVSGINGIFLVYRSTNGGRNWLYVSGAQNTSAYFGQVSMIVEPRSSTNMDSTRVMVYYTSSSNSSMDNAALYVTSFRRDGTAWQNFTVGTPGSGNKFQYPSACSDGMYYNTATYMHCIVMEVTNANAMVSLRHYRTTNWCETHASSTITTAYSDFYPSASFCSKNGTDSIYIAVERRLTNTEYEIRVLTTPDAPSTAYHVYYLTAASTGTKYEKPCLTVQQEQYTTPRKILITSTKDSSYRAARYHGSTNGGSSWSVNYVLGPTTQKSDFTWCNSDSLTLGGGYFVAAYVDTDGDSVTVRRGVLGSMGSYWYKRNSYQSTGTLPPVVAIYKSGTNKYAAFAYAGSGPSDIYFNQENLPAVGIEQIGTQTPEKFSLEQNYPNPFNPVTRIQFNVPANGYVNLTVFDILGREVSVLVSENLKAGSYAYTFDASGLVSGVYFYKITTGDFTSVKKMMLVK